MDYSQLMSKAWTMREQGILTMYEHDLYTYLIHKYYMLNRRNPFNQATSVICAVLSINKNALMLRRKKLQELGLITFREGLTYTRPASYRLYVGKDNSIDGEPQAKEEKAEKVFEPPTLEEVNVYCADRESRVDAQRFFDYYESKNWMVGKNKMNDWQAAVRGWENKQRDYKHNFANYDTKKKHVRF